MPARVLLYGASSNRSINPELGGFPGPARLLAAAAAYTACLLMQTDALLFVRMALEASASVGTALPDKPSDERLKPSPIPAEERVRRRTRGRGKEERRGGDKRLRKRGRR